MKTVITGGGKGCKSLLQLATGSILRELTLTIVCVVDINPDAPGVVYAREIGICTETDIDRVIKNTEIELIIELTGDDTILEELYRIVPAGVRIIDHRFARIFWDVLNAQEERKRQLIEIIELERKIEDERHFLQNIFDEIPDLVIVLDKHRRVTRVNRRLAEFTGLSPENAIGKDCHEVFGNTDLAINCNLDECPFEMVFNQGRSCKVIRRTPPPNETFWEVSMTPISGATGAPEGILGTWYRITEKVMLKREIAAAELKFQRFIESTQAMISIKDLSGKYMVVNSATASFLA